LLLACFSNFHEGCFDISKLIFHVCQLNADHSLAAIQPLTNVTNPRIFRRISEVKEKETGGDHLLHDCTEVFRQCHFHDPIDIAYVRSHWTSRFLAKPGTKT
jgi:hypothetical protein